MRVAAVLLGLALPGPLEAQSCNNFGPMTPDTRISQASLYDQIWGQVSHGYYGVAAAWSAGQDISLRLFDLNLQPSTSDIWVNTTLYAEVQDEPAVCWSTSGNVMVAWSERHGYDGQQMGIFGKLYTSTGAPIGSEFQINVVWQASQWRPLIAKRQGGGFLVAWSGDWDGDAFFRIYDNSGSPQSGDVRVNVFEYDAQVDPTLAQNSSGTIFVAFVDYSSHGTVGTGLNLYGRTFNAAGVPLQPEEFPITTFASNGDQREPRVAVDGFGRFVVVWQDAIFDGSGNGILCRRYDPTGVPIGPEFQVNALTFSDQVEPRVAADGSGGFVITWLDYSQGYGRVLGQRFDPNAQPLGAEFQVNESPAGGITRHELTMDTTGTDVIMAYDGPGQSADVYMRRFTLASTPTSYCTAKTNSQGCLPAIGYSGTLSASNPSPFLITASSVLNNKAGFLIYGFGSSFTPFSGGRLCVGPTFKRTSAQYSGGNPPPNDCSGHYSYDFSERVQSGVDPRLVPGATVSAQYYYRDGHDPTGFGTGLSDALRFTICP